jgi:hypothetical protein
VTDLSQEGPAQTEIQGQSEGQIRAKGQRKVEEEGRVNAPMNSTRVKDSVKTNVAIISVLRWWSALEAHVPISVICPSYFATK